MTIENSTNENTEITTNDPSNPNLSFSEYEKVRRGGEVKISAKTSAPEVKASGQKESTESDTEETEEKDEGLEASGEESDDSSESEKEKPKKKGGFQKRIDKLNARANAERQRADALEARLAEIERLGKSNSNPQEAKPAAAEGKPSPDNFDTHAEYVEALTEWKTEQKLIERDRKLEQNKLEIEQGKALKAHYVREKSFAEKNEDYADLMEEVGFFKDASATVSEVIVSSDNGPALMYELAKNKAEYERINNLPPIAAARELGKIESKIATASSEDKKTEQKKLTNAPKPIDPVGGSKGVNKRSIDDPDISFAEYVARRREQEKRRA